MTTLRATIAHIPMPSRMAHLPLDHRGFPVPWFVHFDDAGVPDFRIIGRGKIEAAVRNRLCWLCGRTMGRQMTFVIGPMCAVSRVSSEPPCHGECAVYSARACPFLSQPKMRRNDKGMEDAPVPGGTMIPRNPGVTALWTTLRYERVSDGLGGQGKLFEVGDPQHVTWWCEGRPATRKECFASIDSGLPLLIDEARRKGGAPAVFELGQMTAAAMRYLPQESEP